MIDNIIELEVQFHQKMIALHSEHITALEHLREHGTTQTQPKTETEQTEPVYESMVGTTFTLNGVQYVVTAQTANRCIAGTNVKTEAGGSDVHYIDVDVEIVKAAS